MAACTAFTGPARPAIRLRPITEVTGNRMAGLLITSNVYLSDISQSNRAIMAALGGSFANVPPISAPNLPAFSGYSGSVGGVTINIAPGAVIVSGIVSEATAQATGALVTDAIVQAVSLALARDIAWQNRAIGNVELN